MVETFLSADKPLFDLKEDRLGYAPYSEYLARVIAEKCPESGLVMAICGGWGTGKSTIINFILSSLLTLSEENRPQVIHFNPWLFAGEAELVQKFFDQLLGAFAKWGKRFKNLKVAVADYAEVIEKSPIPYSSFASLFRILKPKAKNASDLKATVEKLLCNQSRRILVVIDDVDRLTASEVRQLFRVLKAIANFPNVTYLLAFDRSMVVKALEHEQGTDGEAYMEKIVQTTFDVPRIEPQALHRMLFEKLDSLLVELPEGLFDQIRWGNVFHEGIRHFIETPRDVTRLINVLAVTYPPFKKEVNPIDFFALETLRLFCTAAYEAIKRKPDFFTGAISYGAYEEAQKKAVSSYHDDWLQGIPPIHKEAVKRLMIRLFPKVEAIWGGSSYGSDWMPAWRKSLRVCSPNRFPLYFRYSLPSGYISNAEMQEAFAKAGDKEWFAAHLVKLSKEMSPDGTSRLRLFLEILADYASKDIPLEHIHSILCAFFAVGDDLLLPDDGANFNDLGGNELRIGWVIYPLLKRLSEEKRFEVLSISMKNGKAVSLMADKVAYLGYQHGKYGGEAEPEADRLVTSEHLAILEGIVLARIVAASHDSSLLSAPLFARTLYRWADWGSLDDVRHWVKEIASIDGGLAIFISKFGSYAMSHTLTDSVAKRHYRLSPKSFEKFLDPSEIIDRSRALAVNMELPEPFRIALAQFVKEHDLIARGKNPDMPWSHDDGA